MSKSTSPVSLYNIVVSHGWAKLAPWKWDMENCELSRTELTITGEPSTVKVSQTDSRIVQIHVNSEKLDKLSIDQIDQSVRRWLSLDWDPGFAINTAQNIDPRISAFIQQGGGRFLRCSTFYEDFVKRANALFL